MSVGDLFERTRMLLTCDRPAVCGRYLADIVAFIAQKNGFGRRTESDQPPGPEQIAITEVREQGGELAEGSASSGSTSRRNPRAPCGQSRGSCAAPTVRRSATLRAWSSAGSAVERPAPQSAVYRRLSDADQWLRRDNLHGLRPRPPCRMGPAGRCSPLESGRNRM